MLFRSFYVNADEVCKILGLTPHGLCHPDIALFNVDRHIDKIHHISQHRGQHAFENRDSQRLGFHRGDLTDVFDRNLFYRAAGDLHDQTAELFRQRQIGAQAQQNGAIDVGSVDRIANGAPHQVIDYLVGNGNSNVFLRFIRRGAQMRCRNNLVKGQQGIVHRRLLDKHIQSNARYDFRLDGLVQGLFVDNAATGAIKDEHALFHFLEAFRIDDVSGLLRHGRMHRDVIRPGEQLVQCHSLNPQFVDHVRADIGIVADHIHPQAFGAVGDNSPNTPHADDAEDLIEDLLAAKTLLLPFVVLQ